ncbi:unnamed protein product, partial [Rotaria socialis]
YEYKIGDLGGLIADKTDLTNITLKVLACKILSVDLATHGSHMYQLCTKNLHVVNSTILPTMTFDEVCRNLYDVNAMN